MLDLNDYPINFQNPTLIRDTLIDIVNNKQAGVGVLPNLVETYRYYLSTLKAEYIMHAAFEKLYQEPYLLGSMLKVSTEHVTSHMLYAAWLTIDDFRWKDRNGYNKTIPEDLNYGLVLQYPIPIIKSAAYLADYTTRLEEETFSEETIKTLEAVAESLMPQDLSKSRIKVIKAIAKCPPIKETIPDNSPF